MLKEKINCCYLASEHSCPLNNKNGQYWQKRRKFSFNWYGRSLHYSTGKFHVDEVRKLATSILRALHLQGLPTLQKNNEEAYTPLTVSIGPLHRGKEGLQAMEKHKQRYLHNFLGWTQKGLVDFVKLIKEEEERINQCYAETIEFRSDEFVEMILVDTAFIIEVM